MTATCWLATTTRYVAVPEASAPADEGRMPTEPVPADGADEAPGANTGRRRAAPGADAAEGAACPLAVRVVRAAGAADRTRPVGAAEADGAEERPEAAERLEVEAGETGRERSVMPAFGAVERPEAVGADEVVVAAF